MSTPVVEDPSEEPAEERQPCDPGGRGCQAKGHGQRDLEADARRKRPETPVEVHEASSLRGPPRDASRDSVAPGHPTVPAKNRKNSVEQTLFGVLDPVVMDLRDDRDDALHLVLQSE